VNLLLDTHLLLWSAGRSEKFSTEADSLINDPVNALWFSAASLWEIAIKRALDRPDFRTEAGPMRAGLLANGYSEIPVDGRHVLALAGLSPLHGDPFDRILIAQAMSEGMVLVTADRKVAAYPGPIRLV
jgi:PIN domain nuclease of toxin-antitoxin system